MQGGVLQACGHMYLDAGEELDTGTAMDNFLAFNAFTTAGNNSSTGQVLRLLPLSAMLVQRLIRILRVKFQVLKSDWSDHSATAFVYY